MELREDPKADKHPKFQQKVSFIENKTTMKIEKKPKKSQMLNTRPSNLNKAQSDQEQNRKKKILPKKPQEAENKGLLTRPTQ